MQSYQIRNLIAQVERMRLRSDLFYLSKDPLPFRKANYTLPGHSRSTLEETDDFIQGRLEELGYRVEREECQAQAFRCNREKPLHHWYDTPAPDDPWYMVYNQYARKEGVSRPDESIVVVAHKDSPSWYDSPGAYDNASGTAGSLEIARILTQVETERSICFLYCNEEHTPWTSLTAAEGFRQRGERLVAVFNLDSLGGKPQADLDAGRKTNVTRYSHADGKWLADLMMEVNKVYRIGLVQSAYFSAQPNDDDGSFVKANYGAAALNVGSFPYADPHYHMEGDIPERVDVENVVKAVQASLAAILHAANDPW